MHQILSFNFKDLLKTGSLFVIDSKVFALYRKDFEGIDHEKLFLVDDIAKAKSWDQVFKIIHFFYEKNLQKQDEVIAIGGGELTDLIGFAASIFKRGVALVLVPTTLLAMIDASIGGKNGINYEGVKNLVGTFYPAKKVMINPLFLNTLSKNECLSGFAEALKIALVSSKTLWDSLAFDQINDDMIKKCIEQKLHITSLDPYDHGIRHVLNFGHTIGHAYEACSKIEHGFCVALGMIAECYISYYYGNLSYDDYLEIRTKIQSLYKNFPQIEFDSLVNFLKKDKKNEQGKVKVHFLEKIGQFPKLYEVDLDILKQGYESVWM